MFIQIFKIYLLLIHDGLLYKFTDISGRAASLLLFCDPLILLAMALKIGVDDSLVMVRMVKGVAGRAPFTLTATFGASRWGRLVMRGLYFESYP